MLDITGKNAFLVLKKYLEKTDQKRFEHSIRVAQTGKILAEKWGVSKEDAIIAGLLHDIGKSLSKKEMLALCAKNEVEMFDFELFENITALHGKASALLFEQEFNKEDIERFNAISNAISSHVAGSEKMSDLEKIIFIADNIEPEKKTDLLSKIQFGELSEPNECIRRIIEDKAKRANKEKRELNPMLNCTLETIDKGER